MEKYRLFLGEIKRENEKIVKKTIFVNNKIKYKVVNDGIVSYNKYFINSYENEKKYNVYKYYKHKIKNGKKKKIYLDKDFPFFEIYKNRDDSFKNNLPGYMMLQNLNNYNELYIFKYCSKNKLKNYFYLYNNFIEIVLKKRDLYNINEILLLCDHIKNINYYHPYFCKLICREVCLDIYKINDLRKITRFINFLMHFNIFNFYYINKIYKYIVYLITHTNGWKIESNQVDNITINKIDLSKNRHIEEDIIGESDTGSIYDSFIVYSPNGKLLPIEKNDIITLSTSFLKYKYFDMDLLSLQLYVCTHNGYPHLKNAQTLYALSLLCKHYHFVNERYSARSFSDLIKWTMQHSASPNSAAASSAEANNTVMLLKSLYNICKTYGNPDHLSYYSSILQKCYYWDEHDQFKERTTSQESHPYSIFSFRRRKKGIKRDSKKRTEKEDQMNFPFKVDKEGNEISVGVQFQPFNNNLDTNLKKIIINDDYSAVCNGNGASRSPASRLSCDTFANICEIIKYTVLFIELKILQAFPFKKKNAIEIEFLKRKNFERDNNKNIYKYISKNISKEQSENLERILKSNKRKDDSFDDSHLEFLFYLNYKTPHNNANEQKFGQSFRGKMGEKNAKQVEKVEGETEIQTAISSEDINNYISNKQEVKFNLSDGTYFAHVFFHLSSIQLSKSEEDILKKCFGDILFFKSNLQRMDVNDVSDLFYSLTIFQIIQGYHAGKITKNKYGYSKVKNEREHEELYKTLSAILVKKIINMHEENLYKTILSCTNTAYSDVYLNHFLKNFNRYIKFSKMRKFMNC
ncbi:conserved Plasmodium protein, unknown function [Plasmodium ovale]|uniref:Uncharacterized protein n=1 Tax=Plasmodium ovale TaxID=36330 RepID=A0A1D3U8R8_PLAOA|nr:conserved Plasmodium protein, unknown function [Plasmodium ovale]